MVEKFDATALALEGENRNVEIWKIKRLIQKLDNCKGNGTSFVSLYIPPKESMTLVTGRLTQELSQAQNIKSRQTKQSVIAAITSTKEKLKLYRDTPKNGLVVFCGIILMEDGKTEKKINYDIEPFRPIN